VAGVLVPDMIAYQWSADSVANNAAGVAPLDPANAILNAESSMNGDVANVVHNVFDVEIAGQRGLDPSHNVDVGSRAPALDHAAGSGIQALVSPSQPSAPAKFSSAASVTWQPLAWTSSGLIAEAAFGGYSNPFVNVAAVSPTTLASPGSLLAGQQDVAAAPLGSRTFGTVRSSTRGHESFTSGREVQKTIQRQTSSGDSGNNHNCLGTLHLCDYGHTEEATTPAAWLSDARPILDAVFGGEYLGSRRELQGTAPRDGDYGPFAKLAVLLTGCAGSMMAGEANRKRTRSEETPKNPRPV
jgi:hypothetical protein